jgi:hypothetical protein
MDGGITKTYLDYTITNHSDGDSETPVDAVTAAIVMPDFKGAPWESQDGFFSVTISDTVLDALPDTTVFVDFYYEEDAGDGIPISESVAIDIYWRKAAVDGVVIKSVAFDARAGSTVYVPNCVESLDDVEYGAFDTTDFGDSDHSLADAAGHTWNWVDTHVGAAEYAGQPWGDSGTLVKGSPVYIYFGYEQATYTVTVENGVGGGEYGVGEIVSITADAAPSGKAFDKWTSADGVTFANADSASATFTMLDKSVTVTATYKNSSDNSNVGPGTPDATPAPPPPQETEPPVATPEPPDDDFRFIDVAETAWYRDDVYYTYENGLMLGTGADTFSPDDPMTRGMLVTVLGRLAGIDVAGREFGAPFTDVDPEKYYAPYIAWAAENGIVLGIGNNKFAPERAITRQELAAVFARYIAFAGIDYVVTQEYRLFADEDAIADYAKSAVQLLNKLGLLLGVGENTIDPQGQATRAQVAAVLHRFAERVGG